MNLQTGLEELSEFLNKYLADPLNSRTSSWIYTDEGRIELDKTAFPKILIKVADSQSVKELNQIGSYETMNTDIIEIHIKAKQGNHYGVGEDKYTAKEFVSEIASQTETLLKDKRLILEDLNDFQSLICIGDNIIYDKENNPTYILRIELRYIN
jgi:hypothetical protein